VTLPNAVKPLGDLVNVESNLKKRQVFLEHGWIDLGLDAGLHDVVDRQIESYACQRPQPTRISVDERLRVELGAVSIRCTENGDNVVFAELVSCLFDQLLTLRVKRSGGRSDEALGLHEDRHGSGAFDARRYRGALDAIALTDDYGFLPSQLQCHSSSPLSYMSHLVRPPPHHEAAVFFKTHVRIESSGAIVRRLHLQIQHPQMHPTTLFNGSLHRQSAKPGPPERFSHKQVINPGFTSSVFQAEAERQDDVSGNIGVVQEDPRPAQVRFPDKLAKTPLREHVVEGVPHLTVVLPHHSGQFTDISEGCRSYRVRHSESPSEPQGNNPERTTEHSHP
jgi:hypothetical protein